MRLYLVTIRVFNDANSMTTSIILTLYENVRYKKTHAASNLQWLNQVLKEGVQFEVVAVTPYNPERHGIKV